MIGEGVGFERIRRITGYLEELDRFNNGKRAEEHDRKAQRSELLLHASGAPPDER